MIRSFQNVVPGRSLRVLCALPVFLALTIGPAAYAQGGSDSQLQAEAQKALNKKQFSGVQAQVNGGVLTLTGSVSRLSDKLELDRKLGKLKGETSFNDQVQVNVPENVSDQELLQKLSKALVYDRVGYGTTMFNNITIAVHNGIVELGGMVYGPLDKDSAIRLVANTPGVRGIVDNLKVAPVSPMDDRIRRAEAQAVYGAPQLNRYAIDPAKPIRIVVDGGHVTLAGVVDSQGDKDVAGIRANSVPGVFSVANNLQVAGQPVEHQ